ncbi:hypothetical protein H7J07_04680 [Mycobacterium koreense]|uniref:Uncharacterized protein n=1 Tax=Mycolicibacillus koreensis TaxID=1069220 RepID=A0A7I7SC09_9MYCO|nr:hypothetical protein [Mycolicibacillus koreensis]MCV7247552.1 hypothetical protein [Mycolicibacillus koreensis]OSC34610.1 hypothetical protein B8W67_06470 [Mycolicibacillus koreensis]BBY53931.1 hypothetical protein MKOR_11820 [Mycolicibacillus koreensis]
MPSVNVYRFGEFGSCDVHGREVSEADAAAVLESETTGSERRLGRKRVPHEEPGIGRGFKVGTNLDAAYELILVEKY